MHNRDFRPPADPFCKTSFDALLDSLVEIETGGSGMLPPEQAQAQDPPLPFPGFDNSSIAAAQQELTAHQALYQQIMTQQAQLESLSQGLQSHPHRNMQATTSAPQPHLPMSAMHQQQQSLQQQSAFQQQLARQQRGAVTSPPSPSASSLVLNPLQLGVGMLGGGGAPTLRLSLDGRQALPFNLADAREHVPSSSPPLPNHRSRASSYTSDPAYLSEPMASDGESLPCPFPRASLQNLGVMPTHTVDDFHVGGIDVHTQSGSDRRREKNRIAQRRFREKQKTTVAVLQTELDAKEHELQRLMAQLRSQEQTNQVLTAKLLQYESTFGPLPPAQQ